MFDLVVKHILPGMGLFFYFVLHFNCKFAPLLKHYQTQLPTTDILVRGDSGFATPEVYDVCEANDVFYIIRLKRNRKLQNLAEKFVKISDQTQWQEEETHYYSEIYQSASWPKPRQIYIKSTRVAGELIFSHEFIVTNLTNLTAETAFELYHKRSQMENYIKEAKTGFFFDKTDSSTFNANAAPMMVSVLAYNIVNFLKQLALTKHDSGLCVSTLRIRLFKVAARVVHTGRRIQLRLSSYHVYHRLSYQALQRIQAIE
ncbi:IS1380 family transposase [Limosilactobacillus fermentum]|uniref:IS1380 family transposase n=1 Tax=Limosilactobacillus fermentum TaxID=1613 RepID=UPI0006873901|nr:IS1380 family transposase [Limosilactobacillus fermentum]QWQ33546.1 IS1380 family transposase [Limosilactobacillus fermentum]UOG12835.1 IS1380 family transposase [Limosilactobacillus fermentum]URL83507.1 IS1380 family transposase [Limosilactobacillus fermentum]